MKRYRVLLSQTIVENAWVTVEAESEQEALARAEELAVTKELEWKHEETRDREALMVEEESSGRLKIY